MPDVASNDYDVSINRYKKIVFNEIEYQAPVAIADEVTVLDGVLQTGVNNLELVLG